MMAGCAKAVVDAEITLKGLNPEQKDMVAYELTIPNPEYAKRKAAGKWLGGTPEKIALFSKIGDDYVVPYGCLRWVLDTLPVELLVSPHLSTRQRIREWETVSLYPYQRRAVREAVRKAGGIIVAPCGSGKTQMGIALMAEYGLRSLWITHTHDLLRQSMDRTKALLNLDHGDIGTITAGKVDVGRFVTFATVQTLAKIDLSKLHEVFDLIIVDECHKAVGSPTKLTMFWKVLSNLSAKYKFGLTATPKRQDGMTKSMHLLLGETACMISRDEVAHTTCPLETRLIETGWEPEQQEYTNPDGTISYTKLISACTEADERNDLVADVIRMLSTPTIVLGERVQHLEHLKAMVGEGVCLSSASKKERETAIAKIKRGDERVLFATYQLAKEGLDIPCLENLVMATPIKDETAVVQSVGRVMRKSPEKEAGIVWDFEDSMFLFKRWAQKRQKIYRRLQNNG